MQNKILLILSLVLTLGLTSIFGQIQTVEATKSPTTKKSISGGVLNGKAVTLVKPSYPAAANTAGVGGAVIVQVTVDENGDVISAKAVSGDPLLHQECERVARASKFEPTTLEGQPVRITGVVVYNFVPALTMIQIGYELSLAEKSKVIQKYQVNSINGTLPPSWEKEKELLKKLDSLLVEKPTPDTAPKKPATANVNADKPSETLTFRGNSTGIVSKDVATSPNTDQPLRLGIATKIGSVPYDSKYPVSDDALALINELQSALEKRLSVRDNILWSFKLGKTLGRLKAELENGEKTRLNISELNQLVANTPINILQTVTEKIKELIKISNQTLTNAERMEKMSLLIENLRNIKSY